MIKARNIRGMVMGRRRGILVKVRRREMGVPSVMIVCLKYLTGPILGTRASGNASRLCWYTLSSKEYRCCVLQGHEDVESKVSRRNADNVISQDQALLYQTSVMYM
jgi:hypothetical protein